MPPALMQRAGGFGIFDIRVILRYNDHTKTKGELNINIQYIRSGNDFIPDLELPHESRPIGKWGRTHREYLREYQPIRYNCLLLSGDLWTYLADLNEQAQYRLEQMIDQMKAAESVTEGLKAADLMAWVGVMNNIRARAEGIIREELKFETL